MTEEIVRFQLSEDVAHITMDDGKANALSHAMIDALNAAFERARDDASAVLLSGREGTFCAGFHLGTLLSGPEAARKLLTAGAELFMSVYEFPLPVVMACTGHALAGGALLLATGDTRLGVPGEFKIGLNEVQNGMPVPILAHRLAKDRLDPREVVPAVIQAKIYNPEEAAEAGWLDRVVALDELEAASTAEAERLAALPGSAYAASKTSLRRESIDHIRATLQEDIADLMG